MQTSKYYFENNYFHWDSQNRQSLNSDQINNIIENHFDESYGVYLDLRYLESFEYWLVLSVRIVLDFRKMDFFENHCGESYVVYLDLRKIE